MTKNKTAQANVNENSGNTILAVMLLIVAFGFIAYFALPKDFFSWLPEFGNSTISINGSEKVRYDISLDQAQVYDGEKWNEFSTKNGARLNDKLLSYSSVRGDFYKYYFSTNRGDKIIQMDDQYKIELQIINAPLYENTLWFQFWKKNGPIQYLAGDVMISFIKDNKIEGFIILSILDDKLRTVTSKEIVMNPISNDASSGVIHVDTINDVDGILKAHPSWAGTILEKGKTWRDNVLSKPMSISYSQNDKIQTINVCPGKFDYKYLVAYLDDPTEENICK